MWAGDGLTGGNPSVCILKYVALHSPIWIGTKPVTLNLDHLK